MKVQSALVQRARENLENKQYLEALDDVGELADTNTNLAVNLYTTVNRRIVLASSSPHRRRILARVNLSFVCHGPGVDESVLPGESAPALVARLSLAKAKAVAAHYPDGLIIGSDQVADHRGEIIGKPDGHEDAVRQLRSMAGSRITLYSGVVLYDAASDDFQSAVEPFVVEFRELDAGLIERYLKAEQPYDCCGSLKAEGPGIALLKRLTGDDPNALVGLPLIRLIDMLKNVGVALV